MATEAPSYAAAASHRIEQEEESLRAMADLVVDTSSLTVDAVFEKVARFLGDETFPT